MYELRPYQAEARETILNEWEKGHQKTLLVLPTAAGKTVVFASVTDNQVKKGDRVLIMAHREELLNQAADKLYDAVGLESALEKGKQTSIGSNMPVTIGSVQTLCRAERLAKFPKDYFQDIIVDEAHHCLSDTYQRVLGHFPNANILGVTATPDRGDRRNLGEFFDSLAYEYSMAQAVKDGYLCPIKAQMIPIKLDIHRVHMSNGDFDPEEIGIALDPYLEHIAAEMTKYCRDRKTVVFLPLIKTSLKFCEMLNEYGFNAAEVDGKSPDRAEILRDFEKGKYNVLCNSMLLTEGWDCPSVDCIIVLRPTKIRSLYQQEVGRGLRLAPGKKDLLLLDFLWLTDKHNLCKPSSLISKDEAIARRIEREMEHNPESALDLIEAEAEAEKEEVEEEEKKRRDAVAEREKTLAGRMALKSSREKREVDPMQYAMSIEAEDLVNYEPTFAWESKPATQKQLDYIRALGIEPNGIEHAGYASMLIERLKLRRTMNLSTPKQIKCLEKFGFRHVGTWEFAQASRVISAISKHGWTLPRNFDPAQYTP